MNKLKSLFFLSPILFSHVCYASFEKTYYETGTNTNITKTERNNLNETNKFQGAKGFGADGAIVFPLGGKIPTIICSPFNICDIALQAGERVNSVNIGDSVRWNVEPAISGSGNNSVVHIIVKPIDVGLSTSMAIQTDRRSYHLNLKSERRKYMAFVKFTYPEDTQRQWQALRAYQQTNYIDKTLPSGQNINNLNFNYSISGNAKFKPSRVYNDGQQTFIDLPKNLNSDYPILLVVRGNENSMVNYRINQGRYIVDSVFDKGYLILGVGMKQEKITITRSN